MRVSRGFSGQFSISVMRVLVVLTLLAGWAVPSFSQTATGTITGTLTDAQGAAMVGANVVVRNTETGAEKNLVPA